MVNLANGQNHKSRTGTTRSNCFQECCKLTAGTSAPHCEHFINNSPSKARSQITLNFYAIPYSLIRIFPAAEGHGFLLSFNLCGETSPLSAVLFIPRDHSVVKIFLRFSKEPLIPWFFLKYLYKGKKHEPLSTHGLFQLISIPTKPPKRLPVPPHSFALSQDNPLVSSVSRTSRAYLPRLHSVLLKLVHNTLNKVRRDN